MTDEGFRNRTYRDFLDEIGVSNTFPDEDRFVSDAVSPFFYQAENRKWFSPQQDFFAFYGLRNIIRGCIVSCRFIEGGNLLDKSGFYALATIAYYSAAFQLLSTFLAINGKVIIDSPLILFSNEKVEDKLIVAKLCNDNSWMFEGLQRNHSAIWRLLSEVFSERYKHELPGFFCKFLKYMADLNGLPTDLSDKSTVQKIVTAVPMLRHQALYTGFGFDRMAFQQVLRERSEHDTKKIDALSKSLKEFVLDFLSYCLKQISAVKAEIDGMDGFYALYYQLRAGIWHPPFESVREIKLGINDIESELRDLQNWLHI